MFRIKAFLFVLSVPIILLIVSTLSFIILDKSDMINLTAVVVVFVIGWLLLLLFSMVIRCPRCGAGPYSFYAQGKAVLGKPWPGSRCPKCDFDFAKDLPTEVSE